MLTRRRVAAGLACVAVVLLSASALAPSPAWTTYRHDAARSGIDPDSTSPGPPVQVWQTPALDGQVWAEPLVYGSDVYVATENDTVYALNASTGAVVWRKHLAAAVPAGQLPCGDIGPTVGITSTPVIDPATGRIYVVADSWNGSSAASIAHKMYALNVSNGTVAVGPVAVDPPGSTHTAQLQRAGLALDAGKIVIGYGGNDGDCGSYHGWLVAVPESGGSLQSFEVDGHSGENGGAIWGAGNAPPIDSSGNIWIATGNGSSSSFDGQEAVIKLNSNLRGLDWWAPSDWSALDSSDADLGSSMPVLLPDGLVFEIGKQGIGYLLSQGKLGHTGGTPVYSRQVCNGSWGGGIDVNGVIYVTCSDGLRALALNLSSKTFAPLSTWSVNSDAVGPPIFAGGLVWSVGPSIGASNGGLYGLNPTTGATSFYADLGGYEHFTTPSAGGGLLFVANQSGSGRDEVTAFRIVSTTSRAPAILHLRARKVRRKLRLRITLSAPAKVRIVVSQLIYGRIATNRCRAHARHGRRCQMREPWLRRRRSLEGGVNGVRLRMAPLPPGRYLVKVTATGPGGSSAPRTAVVTISG